jgi:hypothetical protein
MSTYDYNYDYGSDGYYGCDYEGYGYWEGSGYDEGYATVAPTHPRRPQTQQQQRPSVFSPRPNWNTWDSQRQAPLDLKNISLWAVVGVGAIVLFAVWEHGRMKKELLDYRR